MKEYINKMSTLTSESDKSIIIYTTILVLAIFLLKYIYKKISIALKTWNNRSISINEDDEQNEDDNDTIESSHNKEQLKKIEEENKIQEKILLMESTVNSILDSIIISTQAGVIIDFNPSSEEMFGYSKEEVIGKSINIIMPSDVAKKHDIYLKNFINTNTDQNVKITREIICQRKDNSKFHGHISISLFETSTEIYFVALIRNINEKKLYEEKIKDAIKKSEEASKSKQMFLASMSHELRTPLNAVIGMSEVLKDTTLDTEQEKYVGSILKSGKNLLNIINDVLDISKIEANELKLEKIEVNLENTISDIVDMLSMHAYEKSIDLSYYVDSKIKNHFIADPTRLSQVLINLTNNAIKFTQKGEVTIQVKLNDQSNKILFEVIDTGIGIKEENIGKIFQSFTQEDDSTTRVYGGTGLGLQISSSLVEIMGGKIDVVSKLNIGSKFFFELDYEIGSELKKLEIAIQEKFLFISDNVSIRSLMKKYTEEFNLQAAVKDINQLLALLNKGKLNKELKVILLVSAENNLDFKLFNTLIAKGVSRENIALGVRINDLNKTKVKAIKQGVQNIIDIPIRKSVFIEQLKNINKTPTTPKASSPTNSKKKVILIDDDKEICNLLELELEHPGIDLVSFSNPEIAASVLEQEKFDLIISDYNMPKVNGKAIYEKFKVSQSKESPFILISGDLEGLPSDLIKNVIFMDKPLKMTFFKQIYFDSLNIDPKKEQQDIPAPPQPKSQVENKANNNQATQKDKLDSTPKTKRKTVLIVDDSEENRSLMVAYLKDQNIILHLAINGQEAVNKAKETTFDLIFMDMQMPIMDGLKATAKLREMKVACPILALTANVFEEEKKSALAAGCNEYIAKPVSKKRINDIVTNLKV